jgi:hypothetical protein
MLYMIFLFGMKSLNYHQMESKLFDLNSIEVIELNELIDMQLRQLIIPMMFHVRVDLFFIKVFNVVSESLFVMNQVRN